MLVVLLLTVAYVAHSSSLVSVDWVNMEPRWNEILIHPFMNIWRVQQFIIRGPWTLQQGCEELLFSSSWRTALIPSCLRLSFRTPEIYYTDPYIDIQITQMSKVSPIIKNDRGDKKEFCDGSLQRLHVKEGGGEILWAPCFSLHSSYWLM